MSDERLVIPGSCVACREYADLRAWKPVVFGERGYAWICSECRDYLTPQELTAVIEFNLTHLPILRDERLVLKTRHPTPEDRTEFRAVADAARAVLEAIDRWEEAESNGDS
jgi:hypothetical protein